MKSANESAIKDIILACKRGILSWEDVAKKALVALADSWSEDLDELFSPTDEEDLEQDQYEEALLSRVEKLERQLLK